MVRNQFQCHKNDSLPFFPTQGDDSSSFLSETCHEDPSVSPNFTPPNPQALKWWPPSFRPGRTGWEGSLLREGRHVAIRFTGIMDSLLCFSHCPGPLPPHGPFSTFPSFSCLAIPMMHLIHFYLYSPGVYFFIIVLSVFDINSILHYCLLSSSLHFISLVAKLASF